MTISAKFTFIHNLKNSQCSKGTKLEAQLSEGLLYILVMIMSNL